MVITLKAFESIRLIFEKSVHYVKLFQRHFKCAIKSITTKENNFLCWYEYLNLLHTSVNTFESIMVL